MLYTFKTLILAIIVRVTNDITKSEETFYVPHIVDKQHKAIALIRKKKLNKLIGRRTDTL